ncbi:MAG: phosphatase PAP2-related protein [Candidatus Paceibacterota bacterium]|jgi:hypothetical protein
MKTLIAKHGTLWSDKFFVISAIASLLFFVGSLFVNYSAILYSTAKAGNATTDILLQNLPLINTDIIFSEGAMLFAIFIAVLLILEPKTIPFTLKSIALFIIIRAIFVSMTHLAPPPDSISSDFSNMRYFSAGADLFFSGHTGLPFMLALVFWENKPLRIFFFISSFVAATAVILGHYHYTIDVFSAFFIAYGIYHISLKFFAKDYKIFKHGLETSAII